MMCTTSRLPPPAWLNEDEPKDEPEDEPKDEPKDKPKEDTRHSTLSLTEMLEQAVEAAEVNLHEASDRLYKANTELQRHRLLGKLRELIARDEDDEDKCSICGLVSVGDDEYCEDCDADVQNSQSPSYVDVCPIAWGEWWVPRKLWYQLHAFGLLTPAGKLEEQYVDSVVIKK